MGAASKSRSRRVGQAALVGGTALALAAALSLSTRSGESSAPFSFKDYINGIDPVQYPNHLRTGIFLGTGESDDTAYWKSVTWEALGEKNPFTGQPFDREKDKVFAFGSQSVLELIRVPTDHLGLFVLSSLKDVGGYSFDYIICHSDGCTVAFEALGSGAIRAGYVFALGTNWTSRDLPPGGLRGAKVIFFMVRGDPIPKIPAPSLLSEGGRLVLKFVKRFGPGAGRRIVVLDPPPGLEGGLFKHHALVESYFEAIRNLMALGETDPLVQEITGFLRQLAPEQDDDKKVARTKERKSKEEEEDRKKKKANGDDGPPPPGCPPDCGPGGPSSGPPSGWSDGSFFSGPPPACPPYCPRGCPPDCPPPPGCPPHCPPGCPPICPPPPSRDSRSADRAGVAAGVEVGDKDFAGPGSRKAK